MSVPTRKRGNKIITSTGRRKFPLSRYSGRLFLLDEQLSNADPKEGAEWIKRHGYVYEEQAQGEQHSSPEESYRRKPVWKRCKYVQDGKNDVSLPNFMGFFT